MANLKVDTVSGIGTEGPVLNGGLHFRSKNYLTLPKGTTTERIATSSGISTVIGAIRYNTDSNKMECYVNDKWMIVSTSSTNLDGGGRGVAAGGNDPAAIDVIEYITISTAGNSIDFGNLNQATQSMPGGTGSSTRGIIGGGQGSPATLNIIDFITFSSTGNASDFGDAFPVDEIVIKSIVLTTLPVSPRFTTPRILLDVPAQKQAVADRLPKSVAFPSDAIVI